VPDRAARTAQLAALALGAALLVAPWFGHFDDTDAQLYQVVARKMAERGGWLDPAYLDHLYPHFREHLPFGFWPFAAADLLGGQPLARAVAAAFSLATLALVAFLARRMLGAWPAIVATLVLALTETFFRYGGATRLDPLLVLLANVAAAPILLGPAGAASWLLAGLAAAGAVLVKGPFGILPLVAACCARAVFDRSPKTLLAGALTATLALVPAVAVVALAPGWWETYGRNQLLASAVGARTDGATQPWFPLVALAGRFWPGLPVLVAGVAVAVRTRSREARMLCLFAAVQIALLCLPSRKVWNHLLIAWPALALVSGCAVLPLTAWLSRHARVAAATCAALALAALLCAPAIGRLVDGAPCVGAREFAGVLDELHPGDPVLVVSSPTSWRMLASLAAERRLEPDPRDALAPAVSTAPRLALATDPVAPAAGWREIGRARGWVLLRNQAR